MKLKSITINRKMQNKRAPAFEYWQFNARLLDNTVISTKQQIFDDTLDDLEIVIEYGLKNLVSKLKEKYGQ
jgi:hypothetical protein